MEVKNRTHHVGRGYLGGNLTFENEVFFTFPLGTPTSSGKANFVTKLVCPQRYSKFIQKQRFEWAQGCPPPHDGFDFLPPPGESDKRQSF